MTPTGRVTFVLLPGLDGTGTTSDAFAARLGHVVRVTFPSPYLPREKLADHVLAAWPAGEVVLVGESYSTAVAVRVAVARPPGLAGVVLVTPTFAARFRWWLRLGLRVPGPALRPPGWALTWLLLNGEGPTAALTSAARAADAWVLRERLREYVADPAADDPVGVGVPVLAVRAARDRVLVPREPPSRPGVEWATLDAPHVAAGAAPEAAAAPVAGFAARVS